MLDKKPTHGFNSHGHAVHAELLDHLPTKTAIQRFNATIAVTITKVVGTMWCAYAFAAFDLLSLPTAIQGGIATIVAWIAQTFLQLVLLSVIMVGQNIQGQALDARAGLTFDHLNYVKNQVDETTYGGIRTVLDRLDAIDSRIVKLQKEDDKNA